MISFTQINFDALDDDKFVPFPIKPKVNPNNPTKFSKMLNRKVSAGFHVRSILNLMENSSKVFFLSPLESLPKLKPTASTWKKFSLWNLWTLIGFLSYMSFHLFYVSQNDNMSHRPKLVTVFIDLYNKYCESQFCGWKKHEKTFVNMKNQKVWKFSLQASIEYYVTLYLNDDEDLDATNQ